MGYLSVNKDNRLFWLGRYHERVATTLAYMLQKYDDMIDGEQFNYAAYCAAIGVKNIYTDPADFMRRYLFDKDNPDSIRVAADMMLGNGIVLREAISSKTLAYLQMTVYALDRAAVSTAPALDLQTAIDDIMAFRGSYDDFIDDDNIRNIIKCGSSVERISLCLSLDFHSNLVPKEIHKLLNRLEKTKLRTDPEAHKILWDCNLADPGDVPYTTRDIIRADEELFVL